MYKNKKTLKKKKLKSFLFYKHFLYTNTNSIFIKYIFNERTKNQDEKQVLQNIEDISTTN